MLKSKLLEVLEEEAILAEARARASAIAYQREAVSQAIDKVSLDKGIDCDDIVVVRFKDGDRKYVLKEVKWCGSQPCLLGRRILTSGKLSKTENEIICGIDDLHCVKKFEDKA